MLAASNAWRSCVGLLFAVLAFTTPQGTFEHPLWCTLFVVYALHNVCCYAWCCAKQRCAQSVGSDELCRKCKPKRDERLLQWDTTLCDGCYDACEKICSQCLQLIAFTSLHWGTGLCDECYDTSEKVCNRCSTRIRLESLHWNSRLCDSCYDGCDKVCRHCCHRIESKSLHWDTGLCDTCYNSCTKTCQFCKQQLNATHLQRDTGLCDECYDTCNKVCKCCSQHIALKSLQWDTGLCDECYDRGIVVRTMAGEVVYRGQHSVIHVHDVLGRLQSKMSDLKCLQLVACSAVSSSSSTSLSARTIFRGNDVLNQSNTPEITLLIVSEPHNGPDMSSAGSASDPPCSSEQTEEGMAALLEQIRSDSDVAVLEQAILERSIEVRWQVAEACRRLKSRKTFHILESLLRDTDVNVQIRAAQAFMEIGGDDVALTRLVDLFDSADVALKNAICVGIAQFSDVNLADSTCGRFTMSVRYDMLARTEPQYAFECARLLTGKHAYNPNCFRKASCSNPHCLGRRGACRWRLVFAKPFVFSCWRASFRWHLEKTRKMLQIVEGGCLGPGQKIESEMAADVGGVQVEQVHVSGADAGHEADIWGEEMQQGSKSLIARGELILSLRKQGLVSVSLRGSAEATS